MNPVPTGGDPANLECSKCGSSNTEFEEYMSTGYAAHHPYWIRRNNPVEVSEYGIKCQDCDHEEDPDTLGLRFEPNDPDDGNWVGR
jgi:hypothetical protein